MGIYFFPIVALPLFPLFIYSMDWEMKDIYIWWKSWSHVNKPGGPDRITLLLSVCMLFLYTMASHPPPEYKTRYPCKCITTCLSGPSADICSDYICLFSRPCPLLRYQNAFSICICVDQEDPISICLSMTATCPRDHPAMI